MNYEKLIEFDSLRWSCIGPCTPHLILKLWIVNKRINRVINRMGEECSTNGRYEKCMKYLAWETWRITTIVRHNLKWRKILKRSVRILNCWVRSFHDSYSILTIRLLVLSIRKASLNNHKRKYDSRQKILIQIVSQMLSAFVTSRYGSVGIETS
jgi:hypothetical protein